MNTKQTKALTFLIKKGPSRDKLLDGFKYAYDKGVALPIGLCVEVDKASPITRDIKTVEVGTPTIDELKHTDDSDHLFDIKGYCYWRFNEVGSFEFCEFEASYNTQTRLGFITLHVPD